MFYTMIGVVINMKKFRFSGEVLCLFFIITIAVFLGKILFDVKEAFGEQINNLANTHNVVEYQVYSNVNGKRMEFLKDMTVMRNKDDLEYFKEMLKVIGEDVKWLDNKLQNYDEEFFKEKNLVVISLVVEDNVLTTRVSDIYKTNDVITIEILKTMKDVQPTKKKNWYAVIEIKDLDSEIDLDIIKN